MSARFLQHGRSLHYVVATARAGSFTAAAERVGVTQPAITKSVAELEQDLGFAIFHRLARGVVLTEQGEAFVERAARLIDQAQDLFQHSSTDPDPHAGVLRIGVCPASIEWLLVDPLTALVSRHRGIRLNMSVCTFDRAVQQLRAGALDVAFGFVTAFEEQPDFRCDALPPMRTTLFVRRSHPLLRCETITTADLAKYEMISPSSSRPYDSYTRQIYEDAGIDSRSMLHFIDFFPLVKRLVATTNAIGVTSAEYVRTAAFRSQFARLPFWEFCPQAPLCCVTPLRPAPRPAVRAFIDICRERLHTPDPIAEDGVGPRFIPTARAFGVLANEDTGALT